MKSEQEIREKLERLRKDKRENTSAGNRAIYKLALVWVLEGEKK